jgi:hypothetical protein
MSVTNDFLLGDRLRNLKRNDRGSQQAHRLDHSLRRGAIQARRDRGRPNASGDHDKDERSARKQDGHESMDRRDHAQNSLH